MAGEQTIGKLLVRILLENKDFKKQIKDVQEDLKGLGEQFDQVSVKISDTFTTAFKAATVAVTGFITASAVVGAQFEKQITAVAALSGITDKTSDAYKALEDKARELGATTAYSATEAADAMKSLASAGLSATQIVGAIGPALLLAGASGSELSDATEIMATTMAQFGLEADQAGRISDTFTVALNQSLFTMDSLQSAMKFAGTTGAGFGKSLEEVVATVAQFRDLGLEGTQAGTAFRGMMAALADPTKEAVGVLKDLGLNMMDVSPQAHSLSEILHTLADAGLSVDESFRIFGREFGASVAAVVKNVADGTSTVDSLIATMGTSAGATETLYDTMMDTIMGRWDNLTSAVEETMLSLFDQFKGPLADLMDALTEVITYTSEVFNEQAGDIRHSAEGLLGGAAEWLRENKELIAAMFIEGANAVRTLLDVMAPLLPLANEIAIAFTSMFLATKVIQFGAAIQGLITKLFALQDAIRLGAAELVTVTGGMYAVVAAIGVLITSLIALTIKYGEAEQAAARLRHEQEAMKGVSDEALTRTLSKYGEVIAASREAETVTRQELAAKGELNGARKEELDLIRDATDAELAALIAQGKLIVSGGQLRTVASVYKEMEEEGIRPVEQGIRDLTKTQQEYQKEADQLQNKLDNLAKTPERFREAAAQNMGFRDMEEIQGRLAGVNDEIKKLDTSVQTLRNSNADAQADLLATYAGDGEVSDGLDGVRKRMGEMGGESEKAAARALKAWQEAFQKITEAAIDERRRQVEALEDVQATELEKFKANQKRELEELQRTQAKALDDLQDAEQKALSEEKLSATQRMRIISEFEQTRTGIISQYAETRTVIEKRQTKELLDFQNKETLDAAKKEIATQKEALQKYASEREKSKNAIAAIDRQGMTESEKLQLDMADFLKENTRLTEAERLRAVNYYTKKIEEARKEEKKEFWKHLGEMASKAAQVAKAIAGEFISILGAVRGYASDAVGMAGDVFGKVIDLSKKAAKAAAGVFTALTGGGVDLGPLSILATALESIQSGDASGSISDVATQLIQSMADNASTFLQGIIEGLPAVISALVEAIPTLIQAVADALPALIAILVKAIPEIITAIADSAPVIVEAIAEAIPQVIDVIADNLPDLLKVIVENLPILINAVAEAIPELVAVLAENLPFLIQAIVENLPTIVQAFVSAIPTVVQALADNLPPLVQALAEQVPVIVQAVVDALPMIVQALTDSIPFIVDALLQAVPMLVRGLVENLPVLIQAILEGLLSLVPMLVEQVTTLVIAVIGMLPDIIEAVVQALPDIIRAVIRSIPQIIQALVDSIPLIITEVIKAVPDIILALVQEIPFMISSLLIAIVEAIPEIAYALVQGIILELIPAMPMIVVELIKSLVESIWQVAEELASKLWDALKSIFGFGKDKDNKYSGISYVPATMRGVTLHEGEAVLTAAENQRRTFGGGFGGAAGAGQSNPSVPVVSPATGGGGGASMEALFAVDGRVVDGVLFRANQNGKGRTLRTMKRLAGVRSGVKTPRFNFWRR